MPAAGSSQLKNTPGAPLQWVGDAASILMLPGRKPTGLLYTFCAEEHERQVVLPSQLAHKLPCLAVSQSWVLRCVFQVEVALARLKDSELDHDDHLVCLEALARLAWSDDTVRQVGAVAAHTTTVCTYMHDGPAPELTYTWLAP